MPYLISEKTTFRPEGKEHFLFTGHKKDFSLFQPLITELLQFRDAKACISTHLLPEYVYEEPEYPEYHLEELNNFHLLVIPVTGYFLSENNFAKNQELEYAKAHGIPVLPILMEDGLEHLFNSSCGNLHLLKYNSIDYKMEIQEFMEVLFGDTEFRKEITQVFPSRIFLSYRKRDYNAACQIIRTIHGMKEFQDIAIWYDDYLKFGEDYNIEIEKNLLDSNLVLLCVTPNLLEDGNYVMNIEYPMALHAGKPVLPVTGIPITNFPEFQDKFPGMEDCVSAEDLQTLKTALSAKLGIYGSTDMEHSPSKKYFLGEAYLNGVLVEINRKRGIDFLLESAKEGYIRAMLRLANMYRLGIFTEQNPMQAGFWWEQAVLALQNQIAKGGNAAQCRVLANTLQELSDLYGQMGYTTSALQALDSLESLVAYNYSKGYIPSRFNPGIISLRRGILLQDEGRISEADHAYTQAEAFLMEEYEQHPLPMAEHVAMLRKKQGELRYLAYKETADCSLLFSAIPYLKTAALLQKELQTASGKISDTQTYIEFTLHLADTLLQLHDLVDTLQQKRQLAFEAKELFEELYVKLQSMPQQYSFPYRFHVESQLERARSAMKQ